MQVTAEQLHFSLEQRFLFLVAAPFYFVPDTLVNVSESTQ